MIKRTVDNNDRFMMFVTDTTVSAPHKKKFKEFKNEQDMFKYVRETCKISFATEVQPFAQLVALKRRFVCHDFSSPVTMCISNTLINNFESHLHCSLGYGLGEEANETFDLILSELGIVPAQHPIFRYLQLSNPAVYKRLTSEDDLIEDFSIVESMPDSIDLCLTEHERLIFDQQYINSLKQEFGYKEV